MRRGEGERGEGEGEGEGEDDGKVKEGGEGGEGEGVECKGDGESDGIEKEEGEGGEGFEGGEGGEGGRGGGCEEVEGERDSNGGALAIVEKENQVQALNAAITSTIIRPLAATAECPICLEEPGLAHSVITTCGHILCLVCAKLLIKVNKKCPICSCPLGDKDYVGLARLQQKEKISVSNDRNNDDKCGHEDADKKHDGCGSRGGGGKGNEIVMSAEMEAIYLEHSNSNIDSHDRDEKSTEVDLKCEGKREAAAAAVAAAVTVAAEGGEYGMEKEIREGGGDGAMRVGGDEVMMDMDAVRVAEEVTGRSHAKIISSTTLTGAGAGIGTGAETETGSKENYKNDDYRRWGGERFHKSVSLVLSACCLHPACIVFYRCPLPQPFYSYPLHILIASSLRFFILSSLSVRHFISKLFSTLYYFFLTPLILHAFTLLNLSPVLSRSFNDCYPSCRILKALTGTAPAR